MITPSNQEHEDLPDEVRTRFIFSVIHLKNLDARVIELAEIPDTFLVSLRKL